MRGRPGWYQTYINWLGFFFFFRMAVAVSSSCLQKSVSELVMWQFVESTNILAFRARDIARRAGQLFSFLQTANEGEDISIGEKHTSG